MIQLHQLLKNKFKDLIISRQYLSDIIRDNNITRKRATFKHFPKTFRGQIRDEKEELIKFFNEISISTSLSVNYCRNDLGKRCIIKTSDNSVFKKYSLLVAISNKKCLGYELYDEGAVNSDRFNIFIEKILKDVKNKLIILDNGQIHKKENTQNIIKNSNNNLLFTIPYHYRLNSIEQWFNQVKHFIKLDKPTTYELLKISLKNSITKRKTL